MLLFGGGEKRRLSFHFSSFSSNQFDWFLLAWQKKKKEKGRQGRNGASQKRKFSFPSWQKCAHQVVVATATAAAAAAAGTVTAAAAATQLKKIGEPLQLFP